MGYGVRLVKLDRAMYGFDIGWKLKFVCDDQDDFWDTVDKIKTSIPPDARRWLPDEKVWWVAEWYLTRIAGLFDNYAQMRGGGASSSQSQSRPHTPPSDRIPTPVRQSFATLHLLPDAPPEVVKAAFRACATLYHPDHGGDTEHMKHVNLAFELAYQWSMQHRKASA